MGINVTETAKELDKIFTKDFRETIENRCTEFLKKYPLNEQALKILISDVAVSTLRHAVICTLVYIFGYDDPDKPKTREEMRKILQIITPQDD